MGNRTHLRTVAFALGLLIAGLTPGSSAGTDPAPPPRAISISASKPVLLVGQQTRISGVIKPSTAYARLGLQRKVTGGWKTIARTQPNLRRKYRFTVEPSTGGVFRYRVIELPWRSHSVRSATVRVTAYRWRDVNTMISDHANGNFNTVATIDGTDYPQSILLDADTATGDEDPPGYFVVNTGRRCAVFDATLGALDSNTEGTEVDARVTGDGSVLAERSFGVGESERLTLDIRGDLLVRVETVDLEPVVERDLGVGTPRVLCAS
jgi:hypothetical protein